MEAAGGKALACVVDIRDEQQIGEAVEKAVSKFGGASVFLVEQIFAPSFNRSFLWVLTSLMYD